MSSDEEMLSWTKGQYTKVAAPEGRAVSSPPNPPRVHQPSGSYPGSVTLIPSNSQQVEKCFRPAKNPRSHTAFPVIQNLLTPQV